MIYPIVVYGSPLLRKKAVEIDRDYPDLKQFIDNMFETMYYSEGIGLAAPQVGKSIRLFVVDATELDEDTDEDLKDFKKVFINPNIISETGDEWLFAEGCLSIPNIREDISRNADVVIEYYDENWEFHREEYTGTKARIIQHEYDHLEGVLFVDKISMLRRRLLKGKLNDIARGKAKDVKYKMRIAVK